MLADRSFVLTTAPEPRSLVCLRAALSDQLPASHRSDDSLLVAGLIVRQAQHWFGAYGPVRLRAGLLGPVIHFEVTRSVDPEADTGPTCPDAYHSMLDILTDRSERFTVSTFAGVLTLSVQKVVHPMARELSIDLRVAA
jgi:hypothetical protein